MADDLHQFLHRDPLYGHGDWSAVVAFVRALMHDSEVPWCHPFAKRLILEQHTPMTQTLVQHLGQLHDERGIDIVAERLARSEPDEPSFATPWCDGKVPFEYVCLEALASIGGPRVIAILDRYLNDPTRARLHDRIAALQVADHPRRTAAPMPPDFPDVLKGIHSMNEVMRDDDPSDTAIADCDHGSDDNEVASVGERRRQIQDQKRRRADVLAALQHLPFPGQIETLSGDGHTRTFTLRHRITDHIRSVADPFSDFGIFASDPKVEYPHGRRRWSSSHTFLCFHVPDGSYWDREYTVDVASNSITTHFREMVHAEPVVVNPDGRSVTVGRTPIATAIESRGNVASNRCNSSVRGIWNNPHKTGRDYYARRANVLLPYKKLCYIAPLHEPLIDVHGLWLVDESERLERFFDSEGHCIDVDGVVNELLIPLHQPKVLTLTAGQYHPADAHDVFARRLPQKLWPELTPVPDVATLDPFMNARFVPHQTGHAAWQTGVDCRYNGWRDINADGVIDETDRAILAEHAGKVYRYNMMQYSYFGANWIGAGYGSRSRNFDSEPPLYVASYDYGAGYDPATGCIALTEPVQPGTTLYVEYAYDAPAEAGKDNIAVYIHDPIEPPIAHRPLTDIQATPK
jgi:hypothetical protein